MSPVKLLPISPVRTGAVPVPGQAADPLFFTPFINTGGVSLPIIATTRITTSIVVRPRVQAGVVNLDLMPRLEVHVEGTKTEPEQIDLKQFHTTLSVQNGQVGRVRGFTGADEEFNRRFLGAKDAEAGETSIVVKVSAKAASPEKVNREPPAPPVPNLPSAPK